MAIKYFGAALRAQIAPDVTAATGASTTLPVELVIDDAASGINKQHLLNAIDAIKARVIQDWPSVGN